MSAPVGKVTLNQLSAKTIEGTDSGKITISNNLQVGGSLTGQAVSSTGLSSSGGLNVTSGAVTTPDITTTGNASIGGDLSVTGGITFVDVSCRDVTASRNGTFAGTLGVTGATTVSSLTASSTINDSANNEVKGYVAGVALSAGSATFDGAITDSNNKTVLGYDSSVDLAAKEITGAGKISNTVGGMDIVGDSTVDKLTVGGAFEVGAFTSAMGGKLTISSGGLEVAGGATTDSLTVTGNLLVNGSTSAVNVEKTLIVKDPVFEIGEAGNANDAKDRGCSYHWHDGTDAKLGFYGVDRSINKFTYVPDASNANEVISGTVGNVKFGDVECSGITLGGDISAVNISASGTLDVTGVSTFTGKTTHNGGIDAASQEIDASIGDFTTRVEAPTGKFTTLTSEDGSTDITVSNNLLLGSKTISTTGNIDGGRVTGTSLIASTGGLTVTVGGATVTAGDVTVSDGDIVVSGAAKSVAAASGKFDSITTKGSAAFVEINSGKSLKATGGADFGTAEVDCGTLDASTTVQAPKVETDELVAETASGDITVSSKLDCGSNNIDCGTMSSTAITTTSHISCSGTVKVDRIEERVSGNDITIGHDLKMGTNNIVTVNDITAAGTVQGQSVTATGACSGNSVSATTSVGGVTGVFSTSSSAPLLTTALAGTAITIDRSVSQNTGTLTTPKLICPTLSTSAVAVDINVDRKIDSNKDIKTSANVECEIIKATDMEIKNASGQEIFSVDSVAGTTSFSGQTFNPLDQQIPDLATTNVTSVAGAINIGSNGDTITFHSGATLVNAGTSYDSSTDLTAKDIKCDKIYKNSSSAGGFAFGTGSITPVDDAGNVTNGVMNLGTSSSKFATVNANSVNGNTLGVTTTSTFTGLATFNGGLRFTSTNCSITEDTSANMMSFNAPTASPDYGYSFKVNGTEKVNFSNTGGITCADVDTTDLSVTNTISAGGIHCGYTGSVTCGDIYKFPNGGSLGRLYNVTSDSLAASAITVTGLGTFNGGITTNDINFGAEIYLKTNAATNAGWFGFVTGYNDGDSTTSLKTYRSNGVHQGTYTFRGSGNESTPVSGYVSTQSSDDRIKHNEQPLTNCLDLVAQLKPQIYDKGDPEKPDEWTKEVGLIAQEIKDIIPSAHISGGLEIGNVKNIQAVDYDQVFTYLIGAVQELAAEVAALKSAA